MKRIDPGELLLGVASALVFLVGASALAYGIWKLL